METTQADFCIVGGGPSGLALALLLVKSGASVAVVERAKGFDREYRGEILQPGAMALLGDLGVLPAVRRRGGYELSRFQLIDHGRVLMNVGYRQLPRPYNFLFSVPQRHVLEALHAACLEYEGFRQFSGSSVHALVVEDDVVKGVRCGRADDEREIRAHCVIAADGRYSRTRKLAGIEYDRAEAFEHDVLWFKLPAMDRSIHDVRVYRDAGSPVLLHDSYPDRLQVGWTLPHQGYQRLAAHGIEHVRRAIATALPPYADLVMEHVGSLTDLTLLDVFTGSARTWARDGLLLIGDCAHTHGPIGAQGVNLAIQDAVVAHEILMRSLHAKDASRGVLAEVEARRRPAVEQITKLQARQGTAMLSTGRLANAIRPVAARILAHTPVHKKVLQQIAFGDRTVKVNSGLFTANPARDAASRLNADR